MSQTEQVPIEDLPQSNPEMPEDQFDTLVNVIDGMPSVRDATPDKTRTPRRLSVILDGPVVPDSLRDLLDSYDGEIVDAEAGYRSGDKSPRLIIDLVFEGRSKGVGYNTIRSWGDSKAFTLPAQALEASGFTVGDKLSITARTGEIKLTAWDD